jgi:hypothetical protein
VFEVVLAFGGIGFALDRGRWSGLDFEFQLPGGELVQRGVQLDTPRRRVAKNPPVLNADLPRSKIWPDLELPVKLDFLPRRQVHLLREVNPEKAAQSGGDQLALAIRHGWRDLDEELAYVLERNLFLADIADPDDQFDRLAVAVGPLLAGAQAQARLQATDLLAPGGEALLLLLLFCCRLHRFLRHRLVVVLPRRNCGQPESLDAVAEAGVVVEPVR